MEKIKLQRLVKVWIEETYYVDEINKKTFKDVLNYDLECEDSQILGDTLEELGPYKIWTENYSKLLDSSHEED